MKIVKKQISEIKPYTNNAKEHPREQIEQLKNSIKEFGNNDPIAIDENNVIIEGHGRLKALTELGYKEVECIVLTGLTEEQKNAYRLVHNQLTMNSGWDLEKLKEELNTIELDMAQLGFDIDLLESMFDKEATEDDFNLEEELEDIEEPTTQIGDLYKLGRHYLLCGDSTKEEDVKNLMQGEVADMVLTDPPYNVDYSSKNKMLNYIDKGAHIQTPIINDKIEDFNLFIDKVFFNMAQNTKEGGAFYIWYAEKEVENIRKALHKNNILLHETLIWVKNNFVIGRLDYQPKHESCLYGWKEGAAHYFTNDRTQDTVIEDKIDLNKLTKQELKDLAKELLYSDKTPTTILREDKPLKNDEHPTMKPIRLMGKLIKNSSRRNEKVLDLFGGSGSTLIACEQLDRNCYMVEYDPKYCDVIIKRWEKLTGGQAELVRNYAGLDRK